MDENKISSALNEIWGFFDEEQKKKALSCKSLDEIFKLAGKPCIPIPDELLDEVSGGFVYFDESVNAWRPGNESTGELEKSMFATEGDAGLHALNLGYGVLPITTEQLASLREFINEQRDLSKKTADKNPNSFTAI